MARTTDRRSPLALVLLALLAEEPMHPYRMHEMIKERRKDRVANVAQRNSVYQTIDRLLRAGLITVRSTTREARRPERTVYALAEPGWEALREWTAGMLADPAREFPEFPAALASAMVLSPAEVQAALEKRAADLVRTIADIRAAMDSVPDLPYLFLLDDEYSIEVKEAELRWIRKVIRSLRTGGLDWDYETIASVALRFG